MTTNQPRKTPPLLVSEILAVYEHSAYSPLWIGLAKMSDGRVLSGTFFVCGTSVPCIYDVADSERYSNERTVGNPTMVPARLDQGRFGVDGPDYKIYMSPLFFVFRDEVIKTMLEHADIPRVADIKNTLESAIARSAPQVCPGTRSATCRSRGPSLPASRR